MPDARTTFSASSVGIHTTFPNPPVILVICSTAAGVDAADGAAEIDAAKDFDAGHLFPHEVGDRRRRLPVTLEHQPAHAARARQPGGLDRVDPPRLAVGNRVHVDVDGALQIRRYR